MTLEHWKEELRQPSIRSMKRMTCNSQISMPHQEAHIRVSSILSAPFNTLLDARAVLANVGESRYWRSGTLCRSSRKCSITCSTQSSWRH